MFLEIKSNESGLKRPKKTFFIKENGCEVTGIRGSGAHWLHTVHRSRLWSNMRMDAAYAYAVVNSTTRNWAHVTLKHPQSPQKMGEGDYGRIPKGFCPLLILGRLEARSSHEFSYFSISFLT